jgi:aryl-alcohol dehydrogenase-like predicted oxidoreductase
MKYGNVQGIDKPISRLVQGTIMLSSKSLARSCQLLDDVLAAGCNTFDLAHHYGNGDCERVMGQWLKTRGVRDQVVILTKGAHHSVDRRRVTSFDITADLFDSLARLKTDYVDLYVLHRDDPTVPVGPIVEILNEHHRAGRIHAFGGSNWSVERIQQANMYAREHDLVPFAASSPHYSLAEQVQPPWDGCVTISGPKHADARAWYQQTQMPVFAWSSIANGFLAGKFDHQDREAFAKNLDVSSAKAYCYDDNFERLERTAQLAREKGLTIPQIAMAYVLHQPLNLFALVGSQSGDELKANIAALETKLTDDEMAWLDLRNGDNKPVSTSSTNLSSP